MRHEALPGKFTEQLGYLGCLLRLAIDDEVKVVERAGFRAARELFLGGDVGVEIEVVL